MMVRLFYSASLWMAMCMFASSEDTPGEERFGALQYDASTHVARRSGGCGRLPPYWPGRNTVVTSQYAGKSWLYRIYLPAAYDLNRPIPLVLQFPGWGMSAELEEQGAGITALADRLGFISVTPQGQADNNHNGGPWYSWNAVGSTQSPGPAGPTCTMAANNPSYCYASCRCSDMPQCDWTTCDDSITPTGTGFSDVYGFIPSLYNTLEEQLCVDTTREFAAGESNGGMMAYQVGVDLANRLAAVFPQFGSFHRGFNMAPRIPLPVMDLHGTMDTTVPANVSLSDNGYYYTTTAEIFDGTAYSRGWKASNLCFGPERHYPTSWDGVYGLYCVAVGYCLGGDVVRCSWNGGHNWFGNSAELNGGLVMEFLLKWTRPSHAGGGRSHNKTAGHVETLANVSILSVEESPTLGDEPLASGDLADVSHDPIVLPVSGAYGDPNNGCLEGEDVVEVGSGYACAPRIAAHGGVGPEPPTPRCFIGGKRASVNGCPGVEDFSVGASAWPICLGKSNETDAYTRGEFHCFWTCPCHGVGASCGKHAHNHCPGASRCERGMLLDRSRGLCVYHPKPLVLDARDSGDVVI